MGKITKEMKTLYERLSKLGFSENFIRANGLPQWWDTEAESIRGAEIEAAAYISKRLNLDVRSLLAKEGVPSFKGSCGVRFKTGNSYGSEHPKVAQYMAMRIAEMVAYSCIPPLLNLPGDAPSIREEILENEEYVNLEALLNWCWRYGIPVVGFDRFPISEVDHNFQGMVTHRYGRPVIILSTEEDLRAVMLFTLAHELGHLVNKHLQNNTIVDGNIDREDCTDPEEIEANGFAINLLFVHHEVVSTNYAHLDARSAKNVHDESSGHATARRTLQLLDAEPDTEVDAIGLINNYLAKNLDLERLDEDSQSYMELVMGAA
ncbi:MAG: hypothetical protein N5P05_004558 (plasmid) [Chroococcopsis gigantea SAG 12.99]|jgi:hypothetical protein|nr:hypothetical protein [Chroococcopsis gigantea SAG 12.99]